jgi:hypothetical protein
MKLYRRELMAMVFVAFLAMPSFVLAHCDTMDGPVVKDAKAALTAGDITPVVKWVKPGDEAEIRDAFQRALQVRKLNPQARQLADNYFFETLVRVHRAGEGAPYTGLKPAGTPAQPGIESADNALETGSSEGLVRLLTDEVAASVRRRFAEAHSASQHARESIAAGRSYVSAYVEFVHYVEQLQQAASGPGHGEQNAGVPHTHN